MRELFPLTMSQYTLIIGLLSNFDLRNSGRLNTLTCSFEWNGSSPMNLQKIANRIIADNDAFRLRPVYRFPWRWKQYVEPYKEEVVPVITFQTDEAYEAWLQKAKDNNVRLLKDRLYDMRILERPGRKFTLWIQMNHFITDGYSMKLLAQQIRALDKEFAGNEPGLPMKKVGSYREAVEKEKSYRRSEKYREDRAYWKKVFRYDRKFSFPAGSRSMKIVCDAEKVTVEGDLYRKLCSFCKEEGISLSTALTSAAAMTAHVITGATCFSMASLSYGRHDGVTRRTMGCLMNSPVMMYRIREDESFSGFSRRNYEENLEMLRHLRFSSLDFTPLSYVLCMAHGMNFNHSWILFSQMDYESEFLAAEPKGRMFWSNTNVSQFYAAVFDVPGEERVTMELRYQIKRFSAEDIENLLAVFYDTLKLLLERRDMPIKAVLDKNPQEVALYDSGSAN